MKNILWKTLKAMGKRFYLYLAAILIMAVLTSLINIISSMLINSLVTMIEEGELDNIENVVLFNLSIGTVVILVWRYFTIIYNREAKYATASLQQKTYEKALKLPLSYYEVHNSGEFLSRLSYNIDKASDIYGSRFRRVITPVISVVVYIIPMFSLNWQLSAVLLAANTVLLLFNMVLNGPMKRVSGMLIRVKAEESQVFLNIIHGITVIIMYYLENIMSNKHKKVLTDWRKAQHKKIQLLPLWKV